MREEKEAEVEKKRAALKERKLRIAEKERLEEMAKRVRLPLHLTLPSSRHAHVFCSRVADARCLHLPQMSAKKLQRYVPRCSLARRSSRHLLTSRIPTFAVSCRMQKRLGRGKKVAH